MTARQRAWGILKETVVDWYKDEAFRLAASLSYYTVLSLAPLTILAVVVLGLAFGREAARGGLADEISGLAGEAGGQVVQEIIAHASEPKSLSLAATISIIVLIVGATGVFGELQAALNRIWDVEPLPGQAVVTMAKNRLLSLAMVGAIAFLLLVSLVVNAVLAAVYQYAAERLPLPPTVLQVLNTTVSYTVVAILFALMFKLLPDAKIAWRDVWLGAAATAALFTVGKAIIGLYLGRAGVGSAYGAAGSMVAMLVWVYYSALILFLGAEFTQAYATFAGRPLVPKPHARKIEHPKNTEAQRNAKSDAA